MKHELDFVCCSKPYTIERYLNGSGQIVEHSLDLRCERCPMALLLAKRYIALLSKGQQAEIYVSDSNSQRDIERYLRMQAYLVTSQKINNYFSLKVVI